jgi:uncharacterized membrane-anchored protein YitT (DUF2179 family)
MIKRCIYIILSSFVSALAVNIFFVPHELLSGGIGGIALIIQYVTKIPAGYSIIFFNIPLFIFSVKKIDLEFTVLTIIGTIAQSIFLILTKDVSNYYYVKDILLSCIYGGVLQGAAVGIIISNHGSLGGSDIVCVYARKTHDIDVGEMTLAINFFIISIGALLFGLDIGLYTLMTMYLVSYFIDKVIKGFNRKKLLFIISNKSGEITQKIKEELNRNSTLILAEGGYSKEGIKIIYCILSLAEVPKAKHIVDELDKRAFLSILDTSEVKGKGFKSVL